MPSFILVHSPLVGPLTWRAVAAEIEKRGAITAVPSLTESWPSDPPYWRAMAGAVAATVQAARLTEPAFLVGHSAAGQFLPHVRELLPEGVAGYLFVDAALPRFEISELDSAPPWFAALLRSLVRDGWLPPWCEWWGEDMLRSALPDDALRLRFQREIKSVPMSFFEERRPVVRGWPDAPCGYLRLSDVFEDAAKEAAELAWPLRRMASHHLGMLTEPVAVAEALLALAAEAQAGARAKAGTLSGT